MYCLFFTVYFIKKTPKDPPSEQSEVSVGGAENNNKRQLYLKQKSIQQKLIIQTVLRQTIQKDTLTL